MDEATLKAQYREKARIKEEAAAEKLKRKEQLEEAAFLYRLKHWNLYPRSPRRCVGRGRGRGGGRLSFCITSNSGISTPARERERARARARERESESESESESEREREKGRQRFCIASNKVQSVPKYKLYKAASTSTCSVAQLGQGVASHTYASFA